MEKRLWDEEWKRTQAERTARKNAEKSVRLMKFSCASGNAKPAITKATMTEIANEIKTTFLSSTRGITYTTGNKSASYTDPDNGFPKGNYLLVNSRTDAVEIYQKICNVIDVPFQAERETNALTFTYKTTLITRMQIYEPQRLR
ncbi:hypothetical protein [Nostoc sp. JL31]|uniref:hypothetical protein n=1 Tax=Nostoc sp. JL31 TaxID=2815395 RepID=UPI0025EEEA91|nr:hypothetical protein [Nostoc sp. JL31]